MGSAISCVVKHPSLLTNTLGRKFGITTFLEKLHASIILLKINDEQLCYSCQRTNCQLHYKEMKKKHQKSS